MSFKKKLLSTAMAVAMASGFSVSQNVSAIHLAEDGIGQLLLAPYYTVQNGYTTKFAIVNTRNDVAVKAKVVIRSKAQSTEVLDFICYLTPSDVCRFEIRDINGQAHLWSNDDSVRNQEGGFASQKELLIPLYDARMLARDALDINEVGHVEIIQGYAVGGTVSVAGEKDPVVITRGMSKYDLAKIFDKGRSQTTPVAGTTISGSSIIPSFISSINPDFIRLKGTVEIVKNDNSDRMGYRIPALAGASITWVGTAPTYPSTSTVFDGRVVANGVFDVVVTQPDPNKSTESALGVEMGPGASDNIYEIETALASSNMYGVYDHDDAGVNRTNMFVTFPTKYRHRIHHVCRPAADSIVDDLRKEEITKGYYTPPFQQSGAVAYNLKAYNNQEGLQTSQVYFSGFDVVTDVLSAEVNWVVPKWPNGYTSGWYDLSFSPAVDANHGVTCNYSGVPVLGFTYNWMLVNNKIMNSVLVSPSIP